MSINITIEGSFEKLKVAINRAAGALDTLCTAMPTSSEFERWLGQLPIIETDDYDGVIDWNERGVFLIKGETFAFTVRNLLGGIDDKIIEIDHTYNLIGVHGYPFAVLGCSYSRNVIYAAWSDQ